MSENKLELSGRVKVINKDAANRSITITYDQGGGGPFRFAKLGCGGTAKSQQRMVAEAIGRLEEAKKPDAVILLGDNFYPSGYQGDRDITQFLGRPYKGINAPFFLAHGNHEYDIRKKVLINGGLENAEGIVRLLSETKSDVQFNKFHMLGNYYTIAVKQQDQEIEALEVVLDSNSFPYDSRQQQWFINVVRDTSAKLININCHHPVMTYGKRHKQSGRPYLQDAERYRKAFVDYFGQQPSFWTSQNKLFKQAFCDCLRSAKKMPTDIAAVFSAHDHLQMVAAGKAVNQFVCGGGGGGLQEAKHLEAGLGRNTVHYYESCHGFAIQICDAMQPQVFMYDASDRGATLRSSSKISRGDGGSVSMETTLHNPGKDCLLANHTKVVRKNKDSSAVFKTKTNFHAHKSTRKHEVTLNDDSVSQFIQAILRYDKSTNREVKEILLACFQLISPSLKVRKFNRQHPLYQFANSVKADLESKKSFAILELLKRAHRMTHGSEQESFFKQILVQLIDKVKRNFIEVHHEYQGVDFYAPREQPDFQKLKSDCLMAFEGLTYSFLSITKPIIPDDYEGLVKGKRTRDRHIQVEYFKSKLSQCATEEAFDAYFSGVVEFLHILSDQNSIRLAGVLCDSVVPIVATWGFDKAKAHFDEYNAQLDDPASSRLENCLALQKMRTDLGCDLGDLAKRCLDFAGDGFDHLILKQVLEALVEHVKDANDMVPTLWEACEQFNHTDDIEELVEQRYSISEQHMQKIFSLNEEYRYTQQNSMIYSRN